eukprot:TRINITY_DN166_c1_g1_i5.p1 TRINITY_DN166_c1_g1~~TRINITY_DN166_c1_g1_i5.p1  ORF type:complete len:216 (-),score=42.91 TRINITY_DN166_c1_g1_i5:432-1079(-)
MAYTISWEIAFALADPMVGCGECGSQTKEKKEKTRKMFLCWMLFDLPLVSEFMIGGNGLIGEDLLTSRKDFAFQFIMWMVVHAGAVCAGHAELFWVVKYFSIPFDVYISWTFYNCIAARELTFPKTDLLVALCKLLADFFYLLPMVYLWGGKLINQRYRAIFNEDTEAERKVIRRKGCFVVICSIATWLSNIALLWWTFRRSISLPAENEERFYN